jgi:hypothetical protein
MNLYQLKIGQEVNIKTEKGIQTCQYMGMATKHPYTDELKIPHTFVFWRGIDNNGEMQPDFTTTNSKTKYVIT